MEFPRVKVPKELQAAGNFLMIGAFCLAVDGCALYSLKRQIKNPRVKVFWAAVILLLPAVGALIYFFLRPNDESVFCCQTKKPLSPSSVVASSPHKDLEDSRSPDSTAASSTTSTIGSPHKRHAVTVVHHGPNGSPARAIH